MTDMTLYIANKNYSSWSLRPWLAMKQAGLGFREVLIPLDLPDTQTKIKAFSGSGKDLVMAALRSGTVSDAERDEIQRFLEETRDE